MNDTQPLVPIFPPPFVKAFLTFAAALFLLSVSTSTITATPLGPYPSYVMASYVTPSPAPAAFLILLSIVSLGMLLAFAFAITSLNFPLLLGSGPPALTATAISRPIIVKIFPFAASFFSFLCLIFANFECPDIKVTP